MESQETIFQDTEFSISGKWYNSYCSELCLDGFQSDRMFEGVYSSHTGSSGSSRVVGFVGKSKMTEGNGIHGTPLSMAIQWRLVNKEEKESFDNTWRWVSSFSGQFHPKQRVEGKSKSYDIENTIELLNAIVATSSMDGYVKYEDAPTMWPQTVTFHQTPKPHCEIQDPGPAIRFEGTAKDHIGGIWKNDQRKGDTIILSLVYDTNQGNVTGRMQGLGYDNFTVHGFGDCKEFDETVAQQGVALVMSAKEGECVLSMAGGVDLKSDVLELWVNRLQSTTYGGRFVQSKLDKLFFKRVKR